MQCVFCLPCRHRLFLPIARSRPPTRAAVCPRARDREGVVAFRPLPELKRRRGVFVRWFAFPSQPHPRKTPFGLLARAPPTPRRRIRCSFHASSASTRFSHPRRTHRHVGRPRRRRARRPARSVPARCARHVVGPAAPGVSRIAQARRARPHPASRARAAARTVHPPSRGVRAERRRRRGVRTRGARQAGLGARTFPRVRGGSRGCARRDAPRFPAVPLRSRRARQPGLAREAHAPRCGRRGRARCLGRKRRRHAHLRHVRPPRIEAHAGRRARRGAGESRRRFSFIFKRGAEGETRRRRADVPVDRPRVVFSFFRPRGVLRERAAPVSCLPGGHPVRHGARHRARPNART